MGFRSYIRQFLAAVLMLFRPSLPWGFAAGSGSSFGNRRKMIWDLLLGVVRFLASQPAAAAGNRRKR